MSKFKIGDKVRVKNERGKHWNFDGKMDHWMGKIVTIKEFDGYYIYIKEDSGENVGNHWAWRENDFEPIELEETIVIYRNRQETIGILKRNGEEIKQSSATCSPTDTYSLETGAKLVVDRLFAPEPYNHKVVCVKRSTNFKDGKIYEVKDGLLYGDNDYKTGTGIIFTPFRNLEEINKEMKAKFIELVED